MQIRAIKDEEIDDVAELWHSSGQAAYGFIPTWATFTLERARQAFRDGIIASCDVWVADDGTVAGYMALKGSYLDRLYVHPDRQRQGVGTRLLEYAKKLCPDGLELHTHQKNTGACDFYRKHQFVAVAYGVSPPPESEPDVEFHWRPGGDG